MANNLGSSSDRPPASLTGLPMKPHTASYNATNDEETSATGTDGVRKKVIRTVRRRKGDPSDRGTVVSERFLDPGSVSQNPSVSGTALAPPPRRLSPRARHAANAYEQRHGTDAVPPSVPPRAYRDFAATGGGARPPRRVSPLAQRAAEENAKAVQREAAPHIPPRDQRFPPPPRRLSPRADYVASTRALTPRNGAEEPPAIPGRARRTPQKPSDSQLEPETSLDPEGNEVRTTLTPRMHIDGPTEWVLQRSSPSESVPVVVSAPPEHLSRRAERYMEVKRRAIEEDAKRKQELEQSAGSERTYAFPPESLYEPRPRWAAAEGGLHTEWSKHCYDGLKWCKRVLREFNNAKRENTSVESLVRTLQPIQVSKGSSCECITRTPCDDSEGRELLGSATYYESCKRYLNLQPVPLARADVPELSDFQDPFSTREDTPQYSAGRRNERRGLATLGGIWCTVDGIREDGRPVTARDVKPPRRVMRVCGGQTIGGPLKLDDEREFFVRCYELLLFPQESISPDAVNYGAEGITLGHLVPPPASSVPLTPRIIDDPVALREFRKRLLTVKDRDSVLANHRDDRWTFQTESRVMEENAEHGDQAMEEEEEEELKPFLTQTIVSVSQRQKFTIDVTLVMLPFVELSEEDGKHMVEVPRFCPDTVVKNRRIQGVSLSFSTRDAFMAAFKALLWATECNISAITFLKSNNPADAGYARLRMAATVSPMMPWVSSIDSESTEGRRRGPYQTKCLDFTALNLLNTKENNEYDALRLEDFIVEEKKGATTQKKSTIFTNTLNMGKDDDMGFVDKNATVVSYIPYGVIRRAVSQRTHDVFDVRVIPRNKVSLIPLKGSQPMQRKKVKEIETEQIDMDVEASIFMEYISRLPALSPVYGVIIDEQRYYIFQEPWVSALAMEKQHRSAPGQIPSMEHNTQLRSIAENTVMMTLKDFMHAILHNRSPSNADAPMFENMEAKLQFGQLLCAELLLLYVAIHGKGLLLGPCPPQRILVRIETSLKDDNEEREEGVTSRHIQLFVPDLGVNSRSWTYERQQCGVLEYISIFYIFSVMRHQKFGEMDSAWTVHDDWWTFLCLSFELLALDGSTLLKPSPPSQSPLPTPLISSFAAPEHILSLWRGILTSGDSGMSTHIREYVRQRVLEAMTPSIDSWISAKAETLEFFGTTGPRKPKKQESPGCVVTPNEGKGAFIGVSLSTMYLQSAQSKSQTPREPGELPIAHAENILAEMPFVFFYREFFDAILDVVLPSTRKGCGIHTPALYLVSNPFFNNINLEEVFDGSWKLPRASQQFFYRQMRKSRAEEAVSVYRREAFQDPLTRRPEAPLLLAGSAAPSSSSGPFLLLSRAGQGEMPPTASDGEGLVTTPLRYRDPTQGRKPPPNRLYTREEQEEIEMCENQVRNALHHQVPPAETPSRPANITDRPASSSHGQVREQRPGQWQDARTMDHSVYSQHPPSTGLEGVSPPPRGTGSPAPRKADPRFDGEFQSIEYELNQMAAPSQTSTSLNSIRRSAWPKEFIESSVQRSRATSVLVDPLQEGSRPGRRHACPSNGSVVYAPEPKPYGDSYYNEVLVPSDRD